MLIEVTDELFTRHDMYDADKWRYLLIVHHCKRSGGTYSGTGDDYYNDFGIGQRAVDSALEPFIAMGLITVRQEGEQNIRTIPISDTRIWHISLVNEMSDTSMRVVEIDGVRPLLIDLQEFVKGVDQDVVAPSLYSMRHFQSMRNLVEVGKHACRLLTSAIEEGRVP